ncbi:MAG: hypothetical protein HEQ39_19895 [Rhizobacter sp.]
MKFQLLTSILFFFQSSQNRQNRRTFSPMASSCSPTALGLGGTHAEVTLVPNAATAFSTVQRQVLHLQASQFVRTAAPAMLATLEAKPLSS